MHEYFSRIQKTINIRCLHINWEEKPNIEALVNGYNFHLKRTKLILACSHFTNSEDDYRDTCMISNFIQAITRVPRLSITWDQMLEESIYE